MIITRLLLDAKPLALNSVFMLPTPHVHIHWYMHKFIYLYLTGKAMLEVSTPCSPHSAVFDKKLLAYQHVQVCRR